MVCRTVASRLSPLIRDLGKLCDPICFHFSIGSPSLLGYSVAGTTEDANWLVDLRLARARCEFQPFKTADWYFSPLSR